MRFHFNDEKTAQAAAYVLSLHPGPMPYMVLIKVLYLADREMLLKHGLPITGDRMVSMKHGPVLSSVLDFINEGRRADSNSAWFRYIGVPTGYDIALQTGVQAPKDELSRFEMNLLEKVDRAYGRMDRWALVDLLHKILPEWENPGESMFNIAPEDILRAERRPEAEIERVQRDAKETWLLDSLQ